MKHKHLVKFPFATEEETEKWESLQDKESQWSPRELAILLYILHSGLNIFHKQCGVLTSFLFTTACFLQLKI